MKNRDGDDVERPDFGRLSYINTQCCGKPVGCTNMSDQCRMRKHPWKVRNATCTPENPCEHCRKKQAVSPVPPPGENSTPAT